MLHAAATVQELVPAGRAPGRAERARRETRPEPAALHPRGVGELLDTAVEVLRARFPALVLLCAGLTFPGLVLQVLSGEWQTSFQMWAALVWVVVALAVQSIAVALVTVIVYGQMQGQPVSAGAALRAGLVRAPALVGLTMLTSMCAFLGALCCLVPGIVLTWMFTVAPSVLVLEGLRPVAAMQRSRSLVRNSFPRWAALLLFLLLLTVPFTLMPDVVIEYFGRDLQAALGLGHATYLLLALACASLLTGVGTALGAVLWTLLYIDLRVRAEGFDLVMRLERLRAARVDGSGA